MTQNVATHLAEIAVEGMTCSACTSAVTGALKAVPGVDDVDVSLLTERATVRFHDTDVDTLVTAIDDAGFAATPVRSHAVASTVLAVQGMTCGSCSTSVREALEGVPGVVSAEVSLITELAVVRHGDLGPEGTRALVEAVDTAGFDAEVRSSAAADAKKEGSSAIELRVFGMAGEESMNTVEEALRQMPGVSSAQGSFATHTIVVTFDTTKTGARAVTRAIQDLGFTAISTETADNSQQIATLDRVKELSAFYWDTWKAFLLGMPVIVLDRLRSRLPHFMVARIGGGVWMDDLISIVLVLPILLGPARRFYVKSYKAIRNGTPTMDVLVTISVTCAFAYSLFTFALSVATGEDKHPMYMWDACAMIIMFVLFGKYLENRARGSTSKALSELLSLVPEEVYIIANDTPEEGELIPIDLLQVGDVVVLRPGERVSADGEILSGESYISESLLTGEAEPVLKRPGDRVVGGTINGVGTLHFRVTQCGSETKLAQIITLIKDAQALRGPIQRYADATAAKFVPLILTLAISTFAGWFVSGLILGKERLPMVFEEHSLFFVCMRLGISVVVVACPCALGLATPTAVMVGTGAGAAHGILVKGGAVFEMGSRVNVVLFDKTGTLTTGRMSVVSTTVAAEHWPLVRALEALSEHPVGKTLANYRHPDESSTMTPGKLLAVENFTAIMGEGATGSVAGRRVFVGRRRNNAVANGDVNVEVDGEIVGSVTLKDSLRSDAPWVVETLKQSGYIVGLVSGDSRHVVEDVAETVGVEEQWVWSQMHPENKVEVIQTLRAQGFEVAFVGDGINDSPALASASVGISMEGATHVAVESADIVMRQASPIKGVPAALDLCKSTMYRIKVNLVASAIYNTTMIPFAMGLLLPFHMMLTPIMASGAMALSSVSVVASSLLLRRWQPPELRGEQGPVARAWARVRQRLRLLRSLGSKEVQYTPV